MEKNSTDPHKGLTGPYSTRPELSKISTDLHQSPFFLSLMCDIKHGLIRESITFNDEESI